MTSSTQAQAMIDYENETKRRDLIRSMRVAEQEKVTRLKHKIYVIEDRIRRLERKEDKMELRLRELARIATYGE